MNCIKQIYCRSFQKVLHLSIPFLPYTKPKILSKQEDVANVCIEKGISTVLIITDASIRQLKLMNHLETALQKANIQYVIYDQTICNPTTQNAREARDVYQKYNCQALIGFGGGSSMDCAKAVGALLARPTKALNQMEGILKVVHKLPLLIAIPTTAGTGSEVTLACVVTDEKTHHKYAITDFNLIPKYAVLDPVITKTLPAYLTACTGMDALTHAIEAYIGRSTTKETRKDAIEAIQIIFSQLKKAYDNGNDLQAREAMCHAAYLAGNAFSKSYVGYIHAIAHSLSGKYNVAHGETNAILLPYVLESYGSCIHKKLATLSRATKLASNEDSDSLAASRFIKEIRQMNAYFHIPPYIKELREEDIHDLAKTADHEANPLYPVPVLMNASQLEGIYETVRGNLYEYKRNPKFSPLTTKILPN